MIENSITLQNLLAHPYVLSDLLFVLLVNLIAIFSKKGCAYRKSNQLLASQFMLAIGFSTSAIAMGFSDGLYFDITMIIIYLVFYHLITQTGDRFLGGLSLIIAGYHFSKVVCQGISLDIDEVLELEYPIIMNGFMVLQLILAFRGFVNGLYARSCNSNKRRYRHLDGGK